jgi:hypothetical protein
VGPDTQFHHREGEIGKGVWRAKQVQPEKGERGKREGWKGKREGRS